MVGEIRDPETAEIAVQSALTGHLVYTTVHANNAFDVLGRFQHMGVDAYNLVSALNGVLAQRLVRDVLQGLQGQGLRRVPRHRLQGPQGDRRAAGAERRAARADRRARAGAASSRKRRAPRAPSRCARPRCAGRKPAKPLSRRSIVSLLWRRKKTAAHRRCAPTASWSRARKAARLAAGDGWRAALDALPEVLKAHRGRQAERGARRPVRALRAAAVERGAEERGAVARARAPPLRRAARRAAPRSGR